MDMRIQGPFIIIDVVIAHQTSNAYLCTKKRKREKVEYWLPKSQVILVEEKIHSYTGASKHTIKIPEWLYYKTFGDYIPLNKRKQPLARIYKGLNTNKM